MSTHNELSWEKEFERVFVDFDPKDISNPLLRAGLRSEDIKSFINSLLSREIEAERGRIVEKIKDLKLKGYEAQSILNSIEATLTFPEFKV